MYSARYLAAREESRVELMALSRIELRKQKAGEESAHHGRARTSPAIDAPTSSCDDAPYISYPRPPSPPLFSFSSSIHFCSLIANSVASSIPTTFSTQTHPPHPNPSK